MEAPSVGVLVVNINGLKMTQEVVDDLLHQTEKCVITVYDQASTEPGTQKYLEDIAEKHGICVVINDAAGDLCRVWNWYANACQLPYLCFLNNDCRIPARFVADNRWILDNEPEVGVVCHPTNAVGDSGDTLKYFVSSDPFVQGHDFCIRRDLWIPVPDELKVWGGDDYLFHRLYQKGYKAAVATSSPIIHYGRQSHKHATTPRALDVAAWHKIRDAWNWQELPHRAPPRPRMIEKA